MFTIPTARQICINLVHNLIAEHDASLRMLQVLLRTKEQSAGLTIMENMAALQETSYERLYRWTQATCRSLTQNTPDHPMVLVPALQALRNRTVLFEFCLTELSTARHSAVVRGFIDALTRGGPGGYVGEVICTE